ncbi:MAG: hypothetical protein ABJ239_03570 [Erythrobacter sp.]
MTTPTITLASLPDVEQATGVFGSVAHSPGAYQDRVVAIMVYIYDIL